uniref:Stilbene synthase n=1 Tax=Psilotum nudum TaxID=3240 RepID=Q9SLX7_PSINU|nr:stilbene synthase [Psilotum nudum]
MTTGEASLMKNGPASRARREERADGPATELAIGTANPSNVFDQETYPDFYFDVTNNTDKPELKAKFQRMCNSLESKKVHVLHGGDVEGQPSMVFIGRILLDVRQGRRSRASAKLAKEASLKALREWGQPNSKITHLVFCTTAPVTLPGVDAALIQSLGLNPSVKRVLLYMQGCFAGGTVLRHAKDLAENNRGARVLVVCSETTAVTFRGPHENHLDNLVGQALFADGASALIVGSDPISDLEKPWFEIRWAGSYLIPESGQAIAGQLKEVGLEFHLTRDVSGLVSKNIVTILNEAFEGTGITDWNDIFIIPHPGGPAILDVIQDRLKLQPEKLQASRHVLAEFGNMSSATVHFSLDQMRRSSVEKGCSTTGEGYELGILLGLGPGMTVESILLKSVPTWTVAS